jgi:hypothetical protein
VKQPEQHRAGTGAPGQLGRERRTVDLRALEPGSIYGPGGSDRTIGHARTLTHCSGRAHYACVKKPKLSKSEQTEPDV